MNPNDFEATTDAVMNVSEIGIASSRDKLGSGNDFNDSFFYESELLAGDELVYPESQIQNVLVLSAILLIALVINLGALPVILFRRTKFGNGLFAVLILCLTISDMAVVFFSVLGSLIIEATHLLWGGGSGSCQVYHFFSAWVTGLSAYLLVAIIGMVMVKTTTSCFQRLRDCRFLLLALLLASGLYSVPELFVRTTVDIGGHEDVCILAASGLAYGLYVAFRLLMRHIIPAILVVAAILRPEAKLSKRVSHLFFGHLSTPCSCGDGGSALKLPHECPTMQTAMLRANAAAETKLTMTNGHHNGSSLSNHRPDVIADSEPNCTTIRFIKNGKVQSRLLIQPEDPHRRKYKLALATAFILVTILNCTLDLAFQIQSVKISASSVEHSQNLATALYAVSHFQQIADPLVFLVAEFVFS